MTQCTQPQIDKLHLLCKNYSGINCSDMSKHLMFCVHIFVIAEYRTACLSAKTENADQLVQSKITDKIVLPEY